MHPRTLIRKTVAELLCGQTDAEGRVYTTRVLPLKKMALPALSVYTLNEDVDGESANTAPRELTREVAMAIEGWVASGDDADDAMDALALQVETAMHADPYLRDTAAESILSGTQMEMVEIGDRMMGLVTLTYTVTYRTMAPEVDAGLYDEFLRAGVETNLGNQVLSSQTAKDVISVRGGT